MSEIDMVILRHADPLGIDNDAIGQAAKEIEVVLQGKDSLFYSSPVESAVASAYELLQSGEIKTSAQQPIVKGELSKEYFFTMHESEKAFAWAKIVTQLARHALQHAHEHHIETGLVVVTHKTVLLAPHFKHRKLNTEHLAVNHLTLHV